MSLKLGLIELQHWIKTLTVTEKEQTERQEQKQEHGMSQKLRNKVQDH